MSTRPPLSWADLLPSWRTGASVVALFAVAALVAREAGPWLEAEGARHALLGMALFFVTSVIAVLAPMLTNLPLVPFAALAWGPGWAAVLLLAGWIAGATLSFTLGRRVREPILRRFPSVRRHADIDRLIDPRRRLLSLVLLRMTFPVDVLSYALGLFSQRTSALENALSTTLGAAPFALFFALVPVMPSGMQGAVLIVSTLLFVLYAAWMLRRARPVADAEGQA
ncbi:MAG: VTT domain-containing protein [Rhizobacter sp.]|nr:VTT domain-containing protein [Rhizobacter sp.]